MSKLVVGVLGALAVAATGAALKWGKQALAAIRAALAPDHQALQQRSAWRLMAGQSGGCNSMRLLIACAPSRSLRCGTLSPDAAIHLIRTQFPGQFPEQSSVSNLRTGVEVHRPAQR